MSQQRWQPANLSPNSEDNKALQRDKFIFFRYQSDDDVTRTIENSDQSRPLHPMLPNADLLKYTFTPAQFNRNNKNPVIVKRFIPESLVSRSAGQGERRLWERDWAGSNSRTSDLSAQSRAFIKMVDQAINFGQEIQNFSVITLKEKQYEVLKFFS